MNFQGLAKIEKVDWYIKLAFDTATKKANDARSNTKATTRVTKSRDIESARLEAVRKVIHKHLSLILTSFPSIDTLPEFYQEMIRLTLDYPRLKKSLGAVNWAIDKSHLFANNHIRKIRATSDLKQIGKIRIECYGRISSILKQISSELEYLEEARKKMKAFPNIKTKTFTVAVVGFPNVGKTTLLYKLTGSKPEINSYAFTTKTLNIAYIKQGPKKVQIIDTPGTLDRFNKMNEIEKQAHLAVKYCADMIIYVFDLTEPFPLSDQKKLLRKTRELDRTVIAYLSKTDILDPSVVAEFEKKNKMNLLKDPEEVKELILEEAGF